MKNTIRLMTKYNNYILLIWYIISIFNTYFDNTLGVNLKVCAEIINVMAVTILMRVMLNGYKKPTLVDFSFCAILMSWFFYYTPKDAANLGYSTIENLFYLTIDLYTILFLIDTFLSLLLETKFLEKYKKKIRTLYKFCVAFLAGFSMIMYIKCFRIF